MITLSNNISSDVIYNSGTLGFAGRGWFYQKPLIWLKLLPVKGIPKITKTLTLHPRKGSYFNKIQIRDDCVINRIGLKNKGLEHWFRKYYPKIKKDDFVIISIAEKDTDTICSMIEELNKCIRIYGVEVNISCPSFEYPKNIEDVILELARLKTTHPLILKVGNKNNVDKVIKYLSKYDKDNKIELVNINSYAVYSALKQQWYGYSGRRVRDVLWKLARRITAESGKPVVVTSVWSEKDILDARTYFGGYKYVFGIGSIILKNIFRVKRLIEFINITTTKE